MTRQRMTLQPGCLAALMLFAFFFLVPFFFAQLMFTAVSRLGFSAEVGLLILIGIFMGSAVNIPVRRIVREKLVPEPTLLFGFERLLPRLGLHPLFPTVRRQRQVTIIAVNLGGCLIPLGVALYETARVLRAANLLVVSWQIREETRLSGVTYTQPEIGEPDDFRILADLTLSTALGGGVDLNVTLRWRHDSEPPTDLERDDVTLGSGVTLNFP